MRVDHVVIHVADLAQAVADYEALGFTVTPGGQHPAFGTHNALIPLADGSYLELIARQPDGSAPTAGGRAARRVQGWLARGEGLADWALLPDDVAAAIHAAQARGADVEGPLPGARQRPDGLWVEWAFGFPAAAALPFFCADVTPRERRVPPGAARHHANGASGIHALHVAVRQLAASQAAHQALLGLEPRPLAEQPLGRAALAFDLPGSTLLLLGPDAAPRPLAVREGLVTLLLHSDGPRQRLDDGRTHGAHLELVPRSAAPH